MSNTLNLRFMEKFVYMLFFVCRVNESVEEFNCELYEEEETAQTAFDLQCDSWKHEGFRLQRGLWSRPDDIDSALASLGNVEFSYRLKKMQLL